ncbi:MAG: hypothetical protein AB9917_13810 [Negativicutes bacterium]
MFKVIARKRGRIVVNVNFHSLQAAYERAEKELQEGRAVELCDTELSRLMPDEALRPYTGGLKV